MDMTIDMDDYYKIVNYLKTKVCPLQREEKLKRIEASCSNSYFTCDCGGRCMCESGANAYGGGGDNAIDIYMDKLSEEDQSLIKFILAL